METINDLLSSMDQMIKELTEIKYTKGLFVVIFRNKNHETFYGLTNGDYNKIAKDKNSQCIMPSPSFSTIKAMDQNEANNYVNQNHCINDDAGRMYFSEVIKLWEYKDLILKYYIDSRERIATLANR